MNLWNKITQLSSEKKNLLISLVAILLLLISLLVIYVFKQRNVIFLPETGARNIIKTVKYQSGKGSDAVNLVGQELQASGDNALRLGTASEQDPTYLGIKFSGPSLPANAKILAARFQFVPLASQSIDLDISIRAQVSGEMSSFSQLSIPSARALTLNQTAFQQLAQLKKGKLYHIDIAPVLQEVKLKRGLGNDMVLIVRSNKLGFESVPIYSASDGFPSLSPNIEIDYVLTSL